MFDLLEQKKHMQDLITQLSFPLDAQKTFTDAFDRISRDKTASARFSCLLQEYDDTEHCSYKHLLTEVKVIGETLGIHEYTISLLLFLCMAEKLRYRYLERGIDEDIYFNAMLDMRYKLEECRLVYGINGSFVPQWYYRFFNLTCFALGRLQFELTATEKPYEIGGITLPAGSKAIYIHIPRTGTKLNHSAVLESYRLAAKMFADEFQSQPITFMCASWLLDPWNLTVLSPTSNIAAFINDFKMVDSGSYDDYEEMWRLFDCLCTEDTSNLPKDSSLRRAYADRMERKEPVGWGRGLFIYRDGKILND